MADKQPIETLDLNHEAKLHWTNVFQRVLNKARTQDAVALCGRLDRYLECLEEWDLDHVVPETPFDWGQTNPEGLLP